MNTASTRALAPAIALLGYRCPPLSFASGLGADGSYPGGVGDSVVLMSHDVVKTPEGFRLGSGTPLSAADIEALVNLLEGRPTTGALIPECLLVKERGRIAWFRRAARRRMYFRPSVGRPFHVEVWWPSLVMVATGHSLRAAAYAGDGRPGVQTQLYIPPLMNISDDGSVCRGSANERIGVELTDLAQWDRVMFETNFAHVNSRRTLRSTRAVSNAAHLRFWRNKARSGDRVRAEEMTPMGQRLGQWLGVN